MIVDCHSHVWDPDDHLTTVFLEQLWQAWPDPPNVDARPEQHWKAARAADRSIVCGLQARNGGINVPNEYLAKYVREHEEKLIGFASIDPTYPLAEDEFRRGVEALGLRGLSLAPAYQGIHPMDEYLRPLYDYCEARRLPVLFQGGTYLRSARLAHARPMDLETVALKHPDLVMIVAHLGEPWIDECLALVRKQPNVYADLSGLYDRPRRLYHGLLRAQEEFVISKILLASDFPFMTLDEALKRMRNVNDVVKGTSLPKVGKDAIDEIIHRESLTVLGLAP